MGTTDLPALPTSRSPLSARPFGTHLLIGELIGRGGMSRVYRGWVRGSGHEVAVKVLRDDLAARPEAVKRFVRERELLQTVASPHVVQVHDLVVHGDELGIVMDLVPGGHLRRAVSFPCTLGEAAGLAAQIADGLAAVHDAGVVHRDLKPENVLVEATPDGGRRLRLTDFGISRLVDSAALTQTQVTGTPGYLAPEVAAGGRVTEAADVYALGVMLYELCTGRQPFLAENPLLLVLAHTRQEPPRPIGMPDPLWDLLSRTLAKDPAARPTAARAAETLRRLAPGLAGLPPCSVPATAPVEVAAAADAAPPTRATRTPPAAPATRASAAPAEARSPYGSPAPPTGRPFVGPVGPADGPDDPGFGTAAGFGPPGPRTRGERRTAGRTITPNEVPRPLLIGGALAAVLALVLGATLGPRLFRDRPDPVVRLDPTTSAPAPSAEELSPSAAAPTHHSSATPHTRPAARPSVLPTPSTTTTTSVPPSSAPTTSTSTTPPVVAPDTAQVARVARTAEDRHASDRHATLAITGVAPGSGQVSSIVVVSTDGSTENRQVVPVADDPTTSSYETTISNLTNGTEYTFTVEVCNTDKKCTTSRPTTFTPYDAPTVRAPQLALVTGQGIRVTARAVVRNANPGSTECSIKVTGTPADADAPERTVASTGESFTFVGKAATTYQATETCRTSNVSDGTAQSGPVTTGAL